MSLEERYVRTRHSPHETTALEQGLGWFSLGLGALEVLAPGAVARGLELPERDDLVMGYGVREIAAGAGILFSEDPEPWLWSRVAGDVLDMATIAMASSKTPRSGAMPALGLAAVGGVFLLDIYAAYRRRQQKH